MFLRTMSAPSPGAENCPFCGAVVGPGAIACVACGAVKGRRMGCAGWLALIGAVFFAWCPRDDGHVLGIPSLRPRRPHGARGSRVCRFGGPMLLGPCQEAPPAGVPQNVAFRETKCLCGIGGRKARTCSDLGARRSGPEERRGRSQTLTA